MKKDTKANAHWAAQNERGNRLFLGITTLMVKYLPAFLMNPCIGFVVLYFYITSPKQRRNIARYQRRLQTAFPDVRLPQSMPVFRQFVAFGEAVCDRFAVWQRKIRYEDLVVEDPDGISAVVDKRGERGQIFVCSHFGNVEVCRALVSHHKGFRLNVLVHSRHAQAFNEALTKAGADEIQLIQVTDLDAAVMMELHKRMDVGEWIAIAADRVPVRGEKTVAVDFLGAQADMPQGAWLLAGLLKTRVNTLFCVKQNGRYHLKLRRFADTADWKRSERHAAVEAAAQGFADALAQECARNPLQWFNFYDFWKDETHG
ncbi:glycosyl transferase family 2 [Neisseria zoodegmatis]|uniref:Glycosyl transferase family 2 n=1 Tax=Neisseria zoodegmatis TaxID=326523 RepID=A0AB38DR84_9NEIS|nr:glycosyl transferase family 2 [Neisseria zoodegmatis]OSI10726.1 glycosyl transferase family 2 [Neisseria zoodegmatis]SNU79700.1 lipid A biosynthesis acyltransferase [Neisseria zoodegmatis]